MQKFLLLWCRPDKTAAPDRDEVAEEINGLAGEINSDAASTGLTIDAAEQAIRAKFPDRLLSMTTPDGKPHF
eukprot:9542342-Alexandrium_andersonii.AAC.1